MELQSDSLRREVKYKIFYSDLPKFYQWITSKSDFKQTYSPRQINSLYLDTRNYDLAFANMTGQSKRIKVRARWYGAVGSPLKNIDIENHKLVVRCEIKRKVNSYSDKIIAGSGSFTALNNSYLNIEKFCIQASESHGLKNAKDLKNSVFICYNRDYYESSKISGLRLTIDKDIRYSIPASEGSPILLAKNYLIVEVKFSPDIRELVSQYMEKFPFRPVRSSKYITAIAQIKKISY